MTARVARAMEPYEGQCPFVMHTKRSNDGHGKRFNNFHICELPAGHFGNHLCPACGFAWALWVQDGLPRPWGGPQRPPAA